MANCSICGKSCGLMSGGKEPYTGHNLLVCNECGALLKQLDSTTKLLNNDEFDSVKSAIETAILKATPQNREIVSSLVKSSEETFKKKLAEKEEADFKNTNTSSHSVNKDRICPVCKKVIAAHEFKCSNCGYSLEEVFLTKEQKNSILASKQAQILKNAFYEYKVEIVSDSGVLGKTSKTELEDTIMSYALNGWRLCSVTTNEIGKNAVLGINTTLNNTILIFERCIKSAE